MTEWRATSVRACLTAYAESLVYAVTGQFTLVGEVTESALADYIVDAGPADGG